MQLCFDQPEWFTALYFLEWNWEDAFCAETAIYTLKNKSASKGSSSDALEELFLVPQRIIQSKVL